MRGRSRHTRTSTVAMSSLAAIFALTTGCASDRVRCNGKIEPINAPMTVPAAHFEAPESEPIRRSESQ